MMAPELVLPAHSLVLALKAKPRRSLAGTQNVALARWMTMTQNVARARWMAANRNVVHSRWTSTECIVNSTGVVVFEEVR
ncbi:MAG: hypothetical protein SGJ27_20715 [Candidatus Melainabacteria bacterium]|nr:hypothetical protein [Candidatus Melainabacteria bacterium]